MEVSPRENPSVVRHTLDTVRVLHDTFLTLQQALHNSRDMADGSKEVDETDEDEDVFEEHIPGRASDDEDIDDIELVFTTAETDSVAMNEDLVSIRDGSTSTMQNVLVETDISKCGVVDEMERDVTRRNTLPAQISYRPLLHREVIGAGRGKMKGGPVRPVPKTETGAQTDITALPGQWKSENYLAHKITYNLTTLPSKFTLPVPRASQVPLGDKTREARRVLLSDINFTSMVPELSRSADQLQKDDDQCQELCKNYPQAFGFMKSFDVGRDGQSVRCCELTRNGSRSSWGSYYGSRCQASSNSISQSCHCQAPRRRHSWRPPSTSFCCQHPGLPWSSVPSSPTRCSPRVSMGDVTRRRINFYKCPPHVHPGQSLPDLRGDLENSDSTDSLVDEAEDYLRHQIDALVIGRKAGRSRRNRRMSEVSPLATFTPSKCAQPFMPRCPRDLKQGYLAKVITGEGRVVIGKVRFCGLVTGKPDPYVGIELPHPNGISDGTFQGYRYFQCDEDHAIFVPFAKVVISWST